MSFSPAASLSTGVTLLSLLLSGCTGLSGPQGVDQEALLPRLAGNAASLNEISGLERAHLQLIATNLVATLVQIPEMRPATVTLQINTPFTAFGNAVIRALEDAGFGMQLVDADQGQNFVSYSKSLSETESGLVTNYGLAVGRIRLSREYVIEADAVYPSSLMTISGTDSIADIQLADNIFAEQGGQSTAFISGAQRAGIPDPNLKASTIDVNEFDKLPEDKRTTQEYVFTEARQRYFESDTRRRVPDLSRYSKHRRTVLIFEDNTTQVMGNANKQAVRLLVREFSDDDIMLIKACLDADGRDEASLNRAIRVEEELAGLGVPTESAYIAPCARISYRHASDNSPTPVELIHYRPK
ncbi:hypothetical protein [Granulosicoccus antarcticus]|uniref:Uncharacterized protein n=1 Tax=Granulosicoccus antarcticus IMCC3135 TaxID=1192854 RepID=A0A2Z2NXB2_9GAMM|nr:hypothetical protein [Granulosicoccus antarcticus]ASJ74398.1 hypothetical protein IMCC3135_21605 [Granulosicoccus antarcticus IMCC3135]